MPGTETHEHEDESEESGNATRTRTDDDRKTDRPRSSGERSERRGAAAKRRKGVTAAAAVARATQHFHQLTGRTPEAVTGVSKSDAGWQVEFEVLELHRIPDSTDVLAAFEVELDSSGNLLSYRRTHRYLRGRPGSDGASP